MWLLVVFFSLTQDKFDIVPVCALARVSFTYLHTTIIPPNEIPGYAPGGHTHQLPKIYRQGAARVHYSAPVVIKWKI